MFNLTIILTFTVLIFVSFFQETIPGFYDFSEAFHRYSNYLKKLLPYYVLRLVKHSNNLLL